MMNFEPINDVKEKNIKLIINMDDQYSIDDKINLFNQCNDGDLISVMEHYSRLINIQILKQFFLIISLNIVFTISLI